MNNAFAKLESLTPALRAYAAHTAVPIVLNTAIGHGRLIVSFEVIGIAKDTRARTADGRYK